MDLFSVFSNVELLEDCYENVDNNTITSLLVHRGVGNNDIERILESHKTQTFTRGEFSDSAFMGHIIVYSRAMHFVHRLQKWTSHVKIGFRGSPKVFCAGRKNIVLNFFRQVIFFFYISDIKNKFVPFFFIGLVL